MVVQRKQIFNSYIKVEVLLYYNLGVFLFCCVANRAPSLQYQHTQYIAENRLKCNKWYLKYHLFMRCDIFGKLVGTLLPYMATSHGDLSDWG